jgi:hypothetical protein
MNMEVDKPRENQSSRGVDLGASYGSLEVRPHRNDPTFIDQHIGHTIEPSRIDHVPACNVNSHDSVCS